MSNFKNIFCIIVFVVCLVVSLAMVPEPECMDGWDSPSIGSQGACSSHGGVRWFNEYKLLSWCGSIAIAFCSFLILSTPEYLEERKRLSEQYLEERMYNSKYPDRAPFCPKCKKLMTKKTVSKGKRKGYVYWACSNFPKCRERKYQVS